MSRNTLRLLAVVLTTLIIAVGFNAFDHLPSGVRAQIDSERTALSAAQKQLHTAQESVSREAAGDPALFHAIPAASQWPSRFQQASGQLDSASRDMDELTRLEKDGHHRDRDHAETLLANVRGLRTTAIAQASGIQKEASQLVERKQHLPDEVQALERSYRAIHAFDLAAVTSAVQRAEADYPDKKSDLDARLGALTGMVQQSDELWQSTADARRKPSDPEAGTLLAASDELQSDAAALPKDAAELQSLTGQLYESWDKILVDMDNHGDTYRQELRTVQTDKGSTTSNESWVDVSRGTYDSMRNDLGMAVEHKPLGKYDSEADHVAQPAGFAYVAPPSQGSNQYGYWDHRDGQSFWVFYGQYALMRDLLFNHQYRPVPGYEWEDYRSYRSRGQTYYGRDFESGTPKYGSGGTVTQDRYSGSTYAKSGGFRDSQYATKSGGYRSSQYSSPSVRNPGEESGGRTFGNNRKPSEPHVAPAPRPAPFHMPSGGGRRFGSGGRRR
jgi:hypothetical protein